MHELYAPIREELSEVERMIRHELRSRHAGVDELVRYGCLLGGKRLRPALLLLAGRAFDRVTRDHLVLAAVVELIHTATLIHDDVLDEASTRRHLATVNVRWDTKSSVLLGDYLFTHAIFLAAQLPSNVPCRVLSRATRIVCEGELRQKSLRGDFTLHEDQYIEIIGAKTAELFACGCELGALFAGAPQASVDRMALYGRNLGVAFQIVDDVLDLNGDEQRVGKSLGTDLEQQKATLPLIHVLQAANAGDRREVLEIARRNGNHRLEALAPFFHRYDAFAYSYAVARRFADEAEQQLDDIPPSSAREALQKLTEFVISRSL
jgi:octaprenyl-diphosphate synthase